MCRNLPRMRSSLRATWRDARVRLCLQSLCCELRRNGSLTDKNRFAVSSKLGRPRNTSTSSLHLLWATDDREYSSRWLLGIELPNLCRCIAGEPSVRRYFSHHCDCRTEIWMTRVASVVGEFHCGLHVTHISTPMTNCKGDA